MSAHNSVEQKNYNAYFIETKCMKEKNKGIKEKERFFPFLNCIWSYEKEKNFQLIIAIFRATIPATK